MATSRTTTTPATVTLTPAADGTVDRDGRRRHVINIYHASHVIQTAFLSTALCGVPCSGPCAHAIFLCKYIYILLSDCADTTLRIFLSVKTNIVQRVERSDIKRHLFVTYVRDAKQRKTCSIKKRDKQAYNCRIMYNIYRAIIYTTDMYHNDVIFV